jgi:hypothetical protein
VIVGAAQQPLLVDLSKRLMALLLAGDHATLVTLREQYARATIREISLTGSGFFIHYDVPADIARVTPARLTGGDIYIELEGVEHGAGCLVFVRDGALAMLEGYLHGDESWPDESIVVSLRDALALPVPR